MRRMSFTNKVAWVAFGAMAIVFSLYPLTYLDMPRNMGLLASKSNALLASPLWQIAFYGHISFGGPSLLSGWTQFSRMLRRKYLRWHRRLGLFYLICVVLSGCCAIYLSFFATAGNIAGLGFLLLGISWISFTLLAYQAVVKRDFRLHGKWMVFSYAACFAAVTLRIWLPLLMIALNGDFEMAYRIVAWLCWVPNLIFAFFWVRRDGIELG